LFIQIATLFIALILALALVSLFSHSKFGRFGQFFHGKSHSDGPLVSNTLVSRLLIWHTAIKAFLYHPIIGIGAYCFRFDSKYYCAIPKIFYKAFVQDLGPHITYLAVLTETGIIGFLGFVLFLLSTIRMALKSVAMADTENQKYFSLGMLILQIYILFSMCMTDAWLWGQCGMLWGIILGVSWANYQIITRSHGNLDYK
jgi:O-antigen ligase